MKKIKFILLALMLLVTTITLSSCNKTVTYQIAGLYIKVVDTGNMTIDDRNPKLYFKYDQNDRFTQYAGALSTLSDTSKLVSEEGDVKKYFFSSDVYVSSQYSNIKIHLIVYQNGKYIVDSEVHQTISNVGTARYSANYTFNGQKYRLDFEAKIKNK